MPHCYGNSGAIMGSHKWLDWRRKYHLSLVWSHSGTWIPVAVRHVANPVTLLYFTPFTVQLSLSSFGGR